MGLLTVFANFRIDSEERLLRMQDSFHSFCEADIETWVVNIRGPLKKEAAEFLRTNLGGRLKLFELESKKGWFHDSRQMLHEINSEYIFFWIEDQLCVSGVNYFNQVVAEMKMFGAEYLLYTAFHDGEGIRSFDGLSSLDSDAIIAVNYDRKSHKRRMRFVSSNKLICATFIISCCCIVKWSLFKRIILENDPLIKRSPMETPFDFEKNQRDTHWLPMRVAQTKREFFAFIDDDHGREKHSLISRGLYPNRISRAAMLEIRESNLKRSSSLFHRRVFYYYREIINRCYSKIIRPFLVKAK
jgi:hypothetical protein